jgi:hypothetical protein
MNKSIKNIGQYLRELSVVVIGVAITLSASYLITSKYEKRNLIVYLNAIKLELEENAVSFEHYAKMFQKSVRYANYVQSHDEKSINQDTINYYAQSREDGFGWGLIRSKTVFSKNAFEVFKTSGAISLMDDNELLLSISGVYNSMEELQTFLDMCFQRKAEEATREWYQKAEGKHNPIPMQFFYKSDLPYHMAQDCEVMSELIKGTLSKIKQTKMVK